MAYKVIILYRLYMPSYFLGTFTEYPLFTIRSIRLFLSRKPIVAFVVGRALRVYECCFEIDK